MNGRAILHPPTFLFYFSPLFIFLGKKIFLRESCRKFPAESALENFPQDLIWFCSASQSILTEYLLSVCISASSLLTVNVNLFNNSSSIAGTIWLFRSGFYFLKPLHTYAEVTPSAHTDQKSYHWLDQLAYAFAHICWHFKDRIFQGHNSLIFLDDAEMKTKLLHLVRVNYISNLLQLSWLGQ